MDIRQYWKPQEEVVPTKKGLCLRPIEYIAVKELVPEIGRALPELDGVVPCYMQSDHIRTCVKLVGSPGTIHFRTPAKENCTLCKNPHFVRTNEPV